MVNPKKNKTKKPLVITPCDIDCRKEEDEANFPNDKKIICFLCRKWSHHHCTGEEDHCLTYIWACRYCRGIAENTSHIHTMISDLKQTITDLVDKVALLQSLQSGRVNDVSIHTSSTNNDTPNSIVIQTPEPTGTVQELTYDELSDTSSENEFITLSQLSIIESESIIQEPLDALLESLTANDADSPSDAPLIEQLTPPSEPVIPHRVLPPESDNNYHDVFIGNVRGTTTIDDVKGHLLDSGVRDIGTITQLSSRYNAAFRVFIGDVNIDNTVYNREHWNERIKVEPYKKRTSTRSRRKSCTDEYRNQRNETSRRRDQRHHNNIFIPHTPRHVRAPSFERTRNLDVMGKSARGTTEYLPHQPSDQSNIGSGFVEAPYQQSEHQRQNHGSAQQPRFVHFMYPHHTQHHRPSNNYGDIIYPQQSRLCTSSGHQSITPHGDHRHPSVHYSPPHSQYVNTAQYNHQ